MTQAGRLDSLYEYFKEGSRVEGAGSPVIGVVDNN